jgi:hypothetical protein
MVLLRCVLSLRAEALGVYPSLLTDSSTLSLVLAVTIEGLLK